LELLEIFMGRNWQDDMENVQWVELLHPFTSMKDLLLHNESIQHVALALEQLAEESVTEALPALKNLFLWGPQPPKSVKAMIGKFIAARQLYGRPVAVHHRESPSQVWQKIHWGVGD
jgi:hypothetical protein